MGNDYEVIGEPDGATDLFRQNKCTFGFIQLMGVVSTVLWFIVLCAWDDWFWIYPVAVNISTIVVYAVDKCSASGMQEEPRCSIWTHRVFLLLVAAGGTPAAAVSLWLLFGCHRRFRRNHKLTGLLGASVGSCVGTFVIMITLTAKGHKLKCL